MDRDEAYDAADTAFHQGTLDEAFLDKLHQEYRGELADELIERTLADIAKAIPKLYERVREEVMEAEAERLLDPQEQEAEKGDRKFHEAYEEGRDVW